MSSALHFSYACGKKRIVNPYILSVGFIIFFILLSMDGSALLVSECGDTNYVSGDADHIVEGTVDKVESKLVKDGYGFNGESVFTYNDLKIEKYIKGNPLKENRVQIVTRGGTAGGISSRAEDEPIFIEGTWVRVYLRETNGNFSLVCADHGVEEILQPDFIAGAPVEIWNRTFGGTGLDQAYSVQQTPDGGFILAGSRSFRNFGYEAWLIKTDGSGNLQWIKPFRGSGISSAYSVLMTQDGGFVVSGYTSPYWSTNSDAWLIKVGGETNGTSNTTDGNMNGTASISPNMGLTAVQSATEKVPAEKAAGFEAALAILIFLAMKMIGWNRR